MKSSRMDAEISENIRTIEEKSLRNLPRLSPAGFHIHLVTRALLPAAASTHPYVTLAKTTPPCRFQRALCYGQYHPTLPPANHAKARFSLKRSVSRFPHLAASLTLTPPWVAK